MNTAFETALVHFFGINTQVARDFFHQEGSIEYLNEVSGLENWNITEVADVEHYGGEGCGDEYYTIVRFTREDGEVAFINFWGYYSSYDGSNYDDCHAVRPQRVEVTQYFRPGATR